MPWGLRSRSASIHEDAIFSDILRRWWVWLVFAILYFFTVDFSAEGLVFDLIVLGVFILIAIVLLFTNKHQYGTFDKDP